MYENFFLVPPSIGGRVSKMEKGRIGRFLVICATLLGGFLTAHAEEPVASRSPTVHHARKKKKPAKAPASSASCRSDADCAFTTFADGACCPTYCPPRVVARQSAEALSKFAASCGQKCPVVDCAPPQMTREPACVGGKCEARAAASPARE